MLTILNLNLKPTGQRINNRGADAVKTARNLISAAAELTARVKYCKYNRNGWNSLLRVYTNRYTTAVIYYPYKAIIKQLYNNFIAVACQRLIYRVIYNVLN